MYVNMILWSVQLALNSCFEWSSLLDCWWIISSQFWIILTVFNKPLQLPQIMCIIILKCSKTGCSFQSNSALVLFSNGHYHRKPMKPLGLKYSFLLSDITFLWHITLTDILCVTVSVVSPEGACFVTLDVWKWGWGWLVNRPQALLSLTRARLW